MFFYDYNTEKLKKKVENYDFPYLKCETAQETFDSLVKSFSDFLVVRSFLYLFSLLKLQGMTTSGAARKLFFRVVFMIEKVNLSTTFYNSFRKKLRLVERFLVTEWFY